MLRCLVVVFALCLAATAGPPAEAEPARPALRFCGTGGLRAYLLSTDAGPYYGLLLHQLAIIDESDTPFEVNEVEFALLDNERVVETRLLSGPDLQRLAEASRQIEAAPIAKASIDLICGDRQVLPRGVRLGGPGLTKGEALLISNQVFAFRGRVRIRVIGTAAGRPAEMKVTLPISTGVSKTHLRFPVRGTWVVKSGPSFDTHHRWALPTEFALDLVQFGPDGRSHTGSGASMADYHAYGQPVLAAADGRVVKAVLGRARVAMQIDVGFGDVVTPAAETITYPAMLEFPAPELSGYPRETVVAEKFQAELSCGDRRTELRIVKPARLELVLVDDHVKVEATPVSWTG